MLLLLLLLLLVIISHFYEITGMSHFCADVWSYVHSVLQCSESLITNNYYFYSTPHCDRCAIHGHSGCLFVCLSVCHTPVTYGWILMWNLWRMVLSADFGL